MPSLRSMRRAVLATVGLLGLLLSSIPASAAAEARGACAAPRTVVLVAPLADRTDGRWRLMHDATPAELVSRRLADALEQEAGHRVMQPRMRTVAADDRPFGDDELLAAARRAHAEVVVSGVVEGFGERDLREAGKFARWGIGAPEASAFAEVRVSLRVLEVATGTVLLEPRAQRTRRTRGVAAAQRRPMPGLGEALDRALGEVVDDLARTLAGRVADGWRASLESPVEGVGWIDAGASRGLFVGQRLEVWRSGIEALDEDHVRIGEDHRVGAIVVEALSGRSRARVRVLEGAVRGGDLVRPCRFDDEVTAAR